MSVNHKEIADKWQKKWEEKKVFKVDENSSKKKFYVLEMYPYPSASGLHMGHALNYTIGDIFARTKRMQGFNVLYPMGFDSFGLPAENAAIKAKSHPKKFTEDAISNYIKQMKSLGLSYDWDRMVQTHKPDYYKWDQWIFLKMYEQGLVYKKKSAVNWCSKCNTVLANEQVHNGKCWRHEDTNVEVKHLNQWFLKITQYADELYEGINKLEGWPETIKKLQRNWIGKSHGTEIIFKINKEDWKVFTTRPDTLYGVTFMVVSAQHDKLFDLVTPQQKKEVESFVKRIKSTKEEDIDLLEKEGVFTGSYAEHPITGEKISVYAGNFVLAEYGSGMVMAVPAHDQRDFEFAKKYNIPIRVVVIPKNQNCVIVHGSNCSEEHSKELPLENERHWRLWIKSQLEKRGFLVSNELYPHDWAPKYDEWKKVFEKNNVNENTVLIGHSSGASFILRYLSETNKKVHKLIFVAPAKYANEGDEVLKEFYNYKLNKNMNNLFDDLVIFYSEADKDRHQKSAKEIHNVLGGKLINLKEHGHFLLRQMGTEEFPEILAEILNQDEAYTEYGMLVNSKEFDGKESEKAKELITEKLKSQGKGKKTVNFRLRDWLISRQRFWGTPIPIINCEKCGEVTVPEKDLPVNLPDDVRFESTENPLREHKKFLNVKCPKCGGKAKRETDTMDTFVNSSWYYLRYADSKNEKKIFEPDKVKYWCPVDMYIGGKEHACMHLIYIRFYTKFLRDIGLLKFDEPAKRLFNQGMLNGPDGNKMSKSLGNVVLPETVSEKYGIDTARLFLVSVASQDKDLNWSDNGVEGSLRFLNRVFFYFSNVKFGKTSKRVENKLHSTIKYMTENIELMRYNFAIIKLRELFESFEEEIAKKDLEQFIKLLAPICPHTAEELWSMIGNKEFVSFEKWPEYDESKIDEKLDYMDELVETLKKDINDVLKIINVEKPKSIKLIISPLWKYKFVELFKEEVSKSRNPKDIIGKIMSTDLKAHGQDVMKLIPAFLKDESKIPKINITLVEEKKHIQSEMKNLETQFGCKIELEEADMLINKVNGTPKDKLLSKSTEQKARNALPGKPAIIIN